MAQTPDSPILSYTQVGSSGPRVLLIMGFGMSGAVWKPQIDGLSGDCQLLHFDNRGIGESEAMGESLSMLDIAKDASRVLDAVNWSCDVHLVGVSMGGMAAQELALYEPKRFASLTLIATHAGGRNTWLPTPKGIFRFVATQISSNRNRPKTLAKLLYPKEFLESCDQDSLRERMRAQIGNAAPRKTLKRQLGAIRNHDTRSRLATLDMPTLIVKPARDILIHPKHSDQLNTTIARSSLMQIADAGHGVTYQSATVLNRRMLEHFHTAENSQCTT